MSPSISTYNVTLVLPVVSGLISSSRSRSDPHRGSFHSLTSSKKLACRKWLLRDPLLRKTSLSVPCPRNPSARRLLVGSRGSVISAFAYPLDDITPLMTVLDPDNMDYYLQEPSQGDSMPRPIPIVSHHDNEMTALRHDTMEGMEGE